MNEFHLVKTTVAAIISRENGDQREVLLIQRGTQPYRNYWCLPGGHIDQNEPAHITVTREIKEETGLDLNAKFYKYFDEIIPEKNIHAVVLIFHGHAVGELRAQPEEVSDVKWFPVSGIASLPLAFQHQEILRDYFGAAHS